MIRGYHKVFSKFDSILFAVRTEHFVENRYEDVGDADSGEQDEADEDAQLEAARLLRPQERHQSGHLGPETAPHRAIRRAGTVLATFGVNQQRSRLMTIYEKKSMVNKDNILWAMNCET